MASVLYAVPVLMFVVADTWEKAQEDVHDQVIDVVNTDSSHAISMIIDEKLPAFAYDQDVHTATSALDYDECALPYLSEPKKETP
jgi:hypothetical protein